MEPLSWTAALEEVSSHAAASLPAASRAVGLLITGAVLALLGRLLVSKLVARSASAIEKRFPHDRGLWGAELQQAAVRVIGAFVFWAVLLLFAAAALEELPLPIVTQLVPGIAYFLSKVILGIVLAFSGVGAGRVAHLWIAGIAERAGLQHAPLLGRLVQASIIVVAMTVAAQQVGLEGGVLKSILSILLASGLGGVALAFGLGSAPIVANIMASHYAAKDLRIGETVHIGGMQGVLREIGPVALVLDIEGDRVHLPARRFCEEASVAVGRNL